MNLADLQKLYPGWIADPRCPNALFYSLPGENWFMLMAYDKLFKLLLVERQSETDGRPMRQYMSGHFDNLNDVSLLRTVLNLHKQETA